MGSFNEGKGLAPGNCRGEISLCRGSKPLFFFFLSGIVVLCFPCAMFAPPGERVSFLPLNFDLAPEMSGANPVFNRYHSSGFERHSKKLQKDR